LKKAGCNVLLIQKSILRDAYNDLSLHFLAKMDIMVVTDVERPDIDFIARTLGCRPVAHIDSFTPDKVTHYTLILFNDTAKLEHCHYCHDWPGMLAVWD
jgi:T-complex protein 1 subunit delta